jgi:glycosyltransferase involved in cell wall biosynthesis
VKLALLKGNRFNPWHLLAFNHLQGSPEVVAFRAESEIQRYFEERDDQSCGFGVEPIYFDTQAGPLTKRIGNRIKARFLHYEPQILPFHDQLKDYDIIQSWELFTDWSAEAIEATLKWDIPLSIMVWDNIPFNMERDPHRRHLKQEVARTAHRFIVHTERSRRMLNIEGLASDRIAKIDPGVDLDTFSPGTGNRSALGLDEDEFVILFVGWLLPRKGIDFLLLALRELVHDVSLKHKKVRLLCVGSGPGRDRVEELVARLHIADGCTFAGALPYDDMPKVFRSADAFVLPSIATPEWQEQFGMSLIEAMACGVPVITTHTGAVPEIVEDAAVLCQPNDFVSL